MVVTLCGGRGFSPILRCLLLGFGGTVITPLAGKTTNWRAGCGRSASPVRREGDSNSIGSPYPYHSLAEFSPERLSPAEVC